jgi:alpha-tubulin suppressor-like RCC1 family protein
VVCWGSNACGELGRSGTDSGRPVAVPGLTDAVEVSGGNCHNCARRTTGDVVCWGSNDSGQLGSGMISGTTPLRATPVVDLTDAVAVRAGANHTCALRDNGAVNCWGANDAQQVGDGSTTARPSPTPIVNLDDLTDPRDRGLGIAAGNDFSCALTAAGVRCWGESADGRIGLPEGEAWNGIAPTTVAGTVGATSVSVGALGCFGCALGAGGVVSCWGCNDAGQLGDASGTSSPGARRVDALPPAASVSVGSNHACALAADGSVWCWGANDSGQLGLGSDAVSAAPTRVGGL